LYAFAAGGITSPAASKEFAMYWHLVFLLVLIAILGLRVKFDIGPK
jgi:hypothetical protein